MHSCGTQLCATVATQGYGRENWRSVYFAGGRIDQLLRVNIDYTRLHNHPLPSSLFHLSPCLCPRGSQSYNERDKIFLWWAHFSLCLHILCLHYFHKISLLHSRWICGIVVNIECTTGCSILYMSATLSVIIYKIIPYIIFSLCGIQSCFKT